MISDSAPGCVECVCASVQRFTTKQTAILLGLINNTTQHSAFFRLTDTFTLFSLLLGVQIKLYI